MPQITSFPLQGIHMPFKCSRETSEMYQGLPFSVTCTFQGNCCQRVFSPFVQSPGSQAAGGLPSPKSWRGFLHRPGGDSPAASGFPASAVCQPQRGLIKCFFLTPHHQPTDRETPLPPWPPSFSLLQVANGVQQF